METTPRKLWPFFAYKFLKGACFITSITFFLFFNEKGLDFFKASALLSLLFLLPLFFEIITGGIADTLGRKFSVLVGIAGEMIIISGIIISSNYFLLLLLFSLWGIFTTFSSGADDAWAIESIPKEHQDKIIDHYYSLSSSLYSLGMILAGVLSGLFLTFYTDRSIWLIRLFFVIAILVILSLTKENFIKEKHNTSNLKMFFNNLRNGFSHFLKNNNTFFIILGEFFATIALVGVGSVALQKYSLQAGLLENNWGYIYSLSATVGIFIPLFAMHLSRKFLNQKTYLIIVFALQIVLYLSASVLLNPFFATILIFLHNTFEDAFNPVNSSFFQKEVPANIRATLSSLRSTVLGLSAFLGTIASGFFANVLTGQITIGIFSVFFIPAILSYTKIKKTTS
jgi:MFS family permease